MSRKDSIRVIKVSELAKKIGQSESETQRTIDKLVRKGFINKIGKNKYDVRPFIDLLMIYSVQSKLGHENNILEIVEFVTGKAYSNNGHKGLKILS